MSRRINETARYCRTKELTRSDQMEYVSLLVVSFERPSTTKVQRAATFQRNPVQACTMQRVECRRHLTFDSRQRIESKLHERHAMRTSTFAYEEPRCSKPSIWSRGCSRSRSRREWNASCKTPSPCIQESKEGPLYKGSSRFSLIH